MEEAGDGEDEDGNSYDSELEADMFGKADPELNAQLDRRYDMLNAAKEERKQAEEAAAAAKAARNDEATEKRSKKPKQTLDPDDFKSSA